MANEVVDDVKKRKKELILFKVDFYILYSEEFSSPLLISYFDFLKKKKK